MTQKRIPGETARPRNQIPAGIPRRSIPGQHSLRPGQPTLQGAVHPQSRERPRTQRQTGPRPRTALSIRLQKPHR